MTAPDEGSQVATAASEAHEALRAAVVRIRNACRMLGIEGAPVASGTAIALADLAGAIVADGDGTDAERLEALQTARDALTAAYSDLLDAELGGMRKSLADDADVQAMRARITDADRAVAADGRA